MYDVDVLKVVISWYDVRHENGVIPDDIDLHVEYNDGGTWKWLDASQTSYDNKERLRVVPVSGKSHRIRVRGYNVTADETVCGANRMQVYYAYFFEDSARNDVDGPTLSSVELE